MSFKHSKNQYKFHRFLNRHISMIGICLLASVISVIAGCGFMKMDSVTGAFVEQHLDKLKQNDYTGAYADYTERAKKLFPEKDYISFCQSIDKKYGKFISYRKDPSEAIEIDNPGQKVDNIVYMVDCEKGKLRAEFSVDIENNDLKLITCKLD